MRDAEMPDRARIYRLLIAHSQPRGPGQGEPGWRYVDLGAVGADVWLVLGLDRPSPPLRGSWSLTNPEPMPSAEQGVEASRLLSGQVELMRQLGVIRSCGMFTEVSLKL